MTKKRCHAACSGCPIAHALDVIGDRWSLLILRELMFNDQHEFADFLAIPEGISTNILADRLKKLVADGLLGSLPHPTNKTKKLYYLTERGIDLIPMVAEMIAWSIRNLPGLPSHPKIDHFKIHRKQVEAGAIRTVRAWNADHAVPDDKRR